ncbi:MAG: ParB N-terminal domain-containing protein [Candidatus Limnocylindrales bacterium]
MPFTVEQVAIDQLRPDPANPRKISDEELDSLERSLREWGFVQPVLARREDRTVIGGHQRLVAARRLGLSTVPVSYLDISVEQAHLLNLALNRIGGSFDEQLLARLLADLQTMPDLDLSLSGFGEDEIAGLLRSLEVREKRERVESFDLDEALAEAIRSMVRNRSYSRPIRPMASASMAPGATACITASDPRRRRTCR